MKPWDYVGWAVIWLGILSGMAVLLLALYVYLAVEIKQRLTDRKRRRAHAGKIVCEDSTCNRIAVRETPHGYYCSEHWEEKSVRRTRGGWVTWSHILNHALKGRQRT